MNDQKDFNDVCILQTRAALKHLPAEMTGMVGLAKREMYGDQISSDIVWWPSLRIQPLLIRSRYYARNATTRFARSSGNELEAAVFAGYWWPNMLMLKWVANYIHVWSNTDQTIDTTLQAAEKAWYACTCQTCLPVQTNKTSPIKLEVFYQMFGGLQILSKRPSTKQSGQTVKCLIVFASVNHADNIMWHKEFHFLLSFVAPGGGGYSPIWAI